MATSSKVEILGSFASPFSIRVEMALNLKSIEYELIEVNFYSNKSQRLLEANPVHKQIPVLIHDDKPVCESLVILQYIDEAWSGHGAPMILPSDPYDRAIARFWASYIDDKWFPTLKELPKASGDEARAAIIGRAFENSMVLEDGFTKCSKGKDFFGGDDVGYVDIVLGSYLVGLDLMGQMVGLKLLDETKTPGLAAWALRFRAHSVAKDVLPEPHKMMEFYNMVQAAKASENTAA